MYVRSELSIAIQNIIFDWCTLLCYNPPLVLHPADLLIASIAAGHFSTLNIALLCC